MAGLTKSKKQLLRITKGYTTGNQDIAVTNVIDINPAAAGGDIEVVSSTMGSKRSYNDEYHTTVSFNVDTLVTGKLENYLGNQYSVLDSLFLISGLKRTSDATSVEYTPSSVESLVVPTINFYKEDNSREITGAVGNLTISGTAGEPLKISFAMSAYTDILPTAETIPTSVETLSDIFLINKITGSTISGADVKMTSFSLTQNASIQDTYATGHASYDIIDFDPSLELVALRQLNELSHWSDFANGTIKSVLISAVSKDTGKLLEIYVPFCKLNALVDGDDAGRQIITRTFRAQNNLGDDNFNIKFSI